MKPVRVLSVGEILMDVVVTERESSLQMTGQIGGSPTNVSAMIASLGTASSLATILGTDLLSTFIEGQLDALGVGWQHSLRVEADTTLAMIQLDDEGVPRYGFRRDPRLAQLVATDAFAQVPLRQFQWIHTGSIGLLYEPERQAFAHLIERALQSGMIVSLDPNVRRVEDVDWTRYKQFITDLITRVPVMKASEEDLQQLYGADWHSRIRQLRDQRLSCITLGSRGALVMYRGQQAHLPAQKVSVVDTTGCGDAFMAGFIHRLLPSAHPTNTMANRRSKDQLQTSGRDQPWVWEEVYTAAAFANRVAEIVAQFPGAGEPAKALSDPAFRAAHLPS